MFEKFGWLGAEAEQRAFDLFTESNPGIFQTAQEVGKKAVDSLRQSRLDLLLKSAPFDVGYAHWLAQQKIYDSNEEKQLILPGPQDIGNCVAYSAALCIALGLGTEIFLDGDPDMALVPYVPWLYGIGRVYEGNNQIRGDGSLGTWQIAAALKYGILWCDEPNLPGPLPEGSASIGRSWGSRRNILDEYKDRASAYPVGKHTVIKSFEDLWEAVVERQQPFTIASGQGFRDAGVDSKYGIRLWRPSGSWPHMMHGRACFEIKGQRFAEIGNQWGLNYHGSIGAGFPVWGSFVTTAEYFDRWVKRGDAFCCTYEVIKSRAIQRPPANVFGDNNEQTKPNSRPSNLFGSERVAC